MEEVVGMMRTLAILVLVVFALSGCRADAGLSSIPSDRPPESLPAVATPSAAPKPTSLPTPTPTFTGEVHWNRIADIPSLLAEDGDVPSGVVGFDEGYVVTYEESGAILFSPDGVTWTTVELPPPKGAVLGVQSVATDGQRVLAVGAYTPCRLAAWSENWVGRCRSRPASWVSDDGLTWRSSDPWSGTVGPTGQGGSQFHHVWAIPTGGWDVAQAFNTGDDSDEGPIVGPVLWHSSDGVSWKKLRAKPDEPVSECDPYWSAAGFWAVADAEGRRLAIEYPGEYCESESRWLVVSLSTDGRRYEPLTTFPRVDISLVLPPTESGQWLLIGSRSLYDPDAEYGVSESVVSASEDLVVWRTAVLPVPADAATSLPWDLAHGTMGYVATGYVEGAPELGVDQVQVGTNDEGDPEADDDEGPVPARRPAVVVPPRRAITWLSDDGVSWRIADVQPSTDLSLETVVNGPAGMLALGTLPASNEPDEDVYRLIAWRLVDGR